MTRMTMTNVREKLSKSREMCPGLKEEVYALTDYMASVANEELVPQGLAMLLVLSLDDVQRGRCGFASSDTKEFPEYLLTHKLQVLAQAVYVPQIVDAIADKEFANEFRTICKQVLKFDPPRRTEKYNQNAPLDGEYPEYITVAVNWWANAIANPSYDNGEDNNAGGIAFLMAMMVNSQNKITDEQINAFKKALADKIMNEMETSWNHESYLSVDYGPDMILSDAAVEAGIEAGINFPWKTSMRISKEIVSVSAGYGAPSKTLWKKA